MKNVSEQAPVFQPRKARRLGLFSRSFLYTTTAMMGGYLSGEALQYVLPESIIEGAQLVTFLTGVGTGMYLAAREATRSYVSLSAFDDSSSTWGARLRITYGAAASAWLAGELLSSSVSLLIHERAWQTPSNPAIGLGFSLIALTGGVAILCAILMRGDSKDAFMRTYGEPVVLNDRPHTQNIKDVTPPDFSRPAITDRRHLDRPMPKL